jgi:hypothetical protein
MNMRSSTVRYSADPVDLGAQSDLVGAPEPTSIGAVLAALNGGRRTFSLVLSVTQRD